MRKYFYFFIIAVIGLFLVNNTLTEHYLTKLEGDALIVSKPIDPLYDEIIQEAEKYEIPPSDAKIDPVWRAIPGLNGVKVDIDASYEKMKKNGVFSPDKLQFIQIPPKVHLDDLTPSPIYKGHPDKPVVSFIINVAWGNEFLPQMLATLKKHHVHATFFLEGRWVKNHPELALMIVEAGHEVGNHSYSHPDMKKLSAEKIREEIVKTNEVIKATTNVTPKWFAPPSGSFRDEVVKIAREEKMHTIMWSVDTIDWRNPQPSELISRVLGKIHNGAIVLMHPTKATAESLETLITSIKERDLEIQTISKLLSEERHIKTLRNK